MIIEIQLNSSFFSECQSNNPQKPILQVHKQFTLVSQINTFHLCDGILGVHMQSNLTQKPFVAICPFNSNLYFKFHITLNICTWALCLLLEVNIHQRHFYQSITSKNKQLYILMNNLHI